MPAGGVASCPTTKRADEPLSATVSTKLIFQFSMRESTISSVGTSASVASRTSRSVRPGPAQRSAEDDPDLGLDARLDQLVEEARLAVLDPHVGEEVTEVGLVDAQHLLHRLGREPDLLPDDLFAGGLAAFDVRELDRVGVVGRELGSARERRDLRALALGGEELVGKRLDVERGGGGHATAALSAAGSA